MRPEEELLAEVRRAILAHETASRLGPGSPPLQPPHGSGPGPLTELAGRAFPAWLLERRLRFLRAVGWIDVVESYRPGVAPALPPVASLADHVAVVSAASTVVTDDAELAAMAAALGRRVDGPRPAAADPDAWRSLFDALADARDPRWRVHRPSPATAAALEAVACEADSWFGRRRSRSPWRVLRGAARRAGETKRRWLG